MVHRIRLGPPWQVTTLDDGRSRHARRFGRPRTVDSTEAVWLVVESLSVGCEVFLNEVPFDIIHPFAVEVTRLLNPRNEVAIHMPADALLGEVALEIRTAS